MSEQGVRAKPSSIAEVLETDEAKGLLEAGREAGSLSTEEISLALGELELDAAQVDDFYHALEELHIEVVDGSEERAEREPTPQAREVTTDSLQLFLKDIGKVDLLTAAQEVELAKRIERGEHLRQAGDGRGQPAPRRLDRQEVPQPGTALPRSDPGGDDRARARGREVRPPQGLQVLDLRDVVDPPGRRPRARGQGADDPDAGPHRREAEQDRPLGAEAARRARARADLVRDRASTSS